MSITSFKNPPISDPELPSQPDSQEPPNFKFERTDWTAFRSIDTLPQKAGVPASLLRRLVLKELVDNALDAGGAVVRLSQDGPDSYVITDNGTGIEGTADEIAHLFSVIRPSISSKQWRLPTRGALGNGIRVAVGAVLVSDGGLVVTTRNRRHDLTPRDDGGTDVQTTEVDFPLGTRIDITFGAAVPYDDNAMVWAQRAIRMTAGADPSYTGKTSPYWYDADAMYELLQGAGDRPVRDLVANLDGCSGAKAGKIAADFLGMKCGELTRDQAIALLGVARFNAKPVRPERLGGIGKAHHLPEAYTKKTGTFVVGGRSPKAELPFVVEAWARPLPAGQRSTAAVCVNRTPVADKVKVGREKLRITIIGGGIKHYVDVGRGDFEITVNLTTPFCPVVDSGKRPDFEPFIRDVLEAIESAVRKAKVARPSEKKRTRKAVVLEYLQEAIDKASGGGQYKFAQRQVLYVVRPYVQRELGVGLETSYFNDIITEYEDEHGEIDGMTREPRGSLTHPHGGLPIPMGTLSVDAYDRPIYQYNKIIYIEKEGFTETLKAAQWPERHDCALVSSKGYAGRAVKDLIDDLAESEEPIQVFCVHDADAPGSMIFHTLANETKARGNRLVEIVNLGLDPWEAIRMGLEVEDVKYDKRQAVAEYITNHPDGAQWERWLQTHRVELNAMTSPQFIAWLDRKMDEHSTGKVIPPDEFVIGSIRDRAEDLIRERLTERILRAAGLEGLVAAAVQDLDMPEADSIRADMLEFFARHPAEPWRTRVNEIARLIAANDNEPEQQAS